MTMSVKEDYEKTGNILLAAADLIREQGWIQADFETSEGFCMIGAIREVNDPYLVASHPTYEQRSKAYFETARATEALMTHRSMMEPTTWNDAKGRTKREVIDLLEYAAGVCFKKAGVS